MTIEQLTLTNFTVFQDIEVEFSHGLNVLIGENGSGKSHLLKLLYVLLKSGRIDESEEEAGREIKARFAATFRPDGDNVGRLVRSGEESSRYVLQTDVGRIGGTVDDQGEVLVTLSSWTRPLPALFLPAREVLSMYEGFVPLYQSKALSFDETYYDTCVALQAPLQRGPAKEAAETLSEPIYKVLGGRVELDGPRFYVDFGEGKREAHLVAEGLRKLAALAHLIDTGAVAAGTVLMWDEPEANLNPRIITKLAEPLMHLATHGVQILLATHDFLLPHRLSLMAEFGQDLPIRFFSLTRTASYVGVQIESAPIISQLGNNPILEEYARYYEDQRDVYNKTLLAALQKDIP